MSRIVLFVIAINVLFSIVASVSNCLIRFKSSLTSLTVIIGSSLKIEYPPVRVTLDPTPLYDSKNVI